MQSNVVLDQYEIYTDGGGNTGNGSWAYGLIINNDMEHIVIGKSPDTTNNRMEMMAVLSAIKSLPLGSNVKIYTDSSYVKKGFHDPSYLQAWVNNGWKTSNRKPVKNQDLWQEMLRLSLFYKIIIELVPGHSGIRFNEMVDRACTWMLKNFDKVGNIVHYNVKEEKVYEFDTCTRS